MSANQTERIVTKLKEIVEKNSPNYLADEPYKVYTELTGSGASDEKTAGAILHFLVNGMLKHAVEDCTADELSEKIQKNCGLSKEMADKLTAIFLSLYSLQNREEWKRMDLQGLEQFKKEEFSTSWKGFSVWNYYGGHVSCHYEADITLMPTEEMVVDPELAESLRKNPFMTKEAIKKHYVELIRHYLDYEFEDYCTCDDYYQPTVEDFFFDRDPARTWCNKNGFELVACEGDGYDNGYEPDIMRGGL